jgi:polyisoprenoid-binding protein YceI
MKRTFRITITAAAIAMATAPLPVLAQQESAAAGTATPVEVQGGTAAFDAGTNIPAVTVHGKSTSLTGRAQIRQSGDAITIEQMQATVPVKSIGTGMGLRDEHMRRYVFTTQNGETPDLKFAADKSQCSAWTGTESTCQLSGQLSIRGTERPFQMALKVTKAGDQYRALGETIVKLSSYGIPAPSQLGVKTDDEVQLRLEFTAKPTTLMTRAGGER